MNQAYFSGLWNFNPGNRAKSASEVWRIRPRSMASAAKCASVVRFPAVPNPFRREAHLSK